MNRRHALEIWKSRLGRRATYKALIIAFLEAGRQDYAYIVSGLFKDPRVSSKSDE